MPRRQARWDPEILGVARNPEKAASSTAMLKTQERFVEGATGGRADVASITLGIGNAMESHRGTRQVSLCRQEDSTGLLVVKRTFDAYQSDSVWAIE